MNETTPSLSEAKAVVGNIVASSGLVPTTREDALPIPNEPSRALSAFSSEANYIASLRMAKALSQSSLVPVAYQGTDNIPNVLIAMELANRIGASVFMVMQNLDVIHGRPSWRAQFLIATVNASGRFTPLRFRWQGSAGSDDWGCRATAKDRSDGEPCVGPLITIAVAKAEGWMAKNGSKWKTLPELMMMYRAAAFWTRTYAPELSLGMHTAEEVTDMSAPGLDGVPGFVQGDTKALEAELNGRDITRIAMPDAPAPEPEATPAAKPTPAPPPPAPKPPEPPPSPAATSLDAILGPKHDTDGVVREPITGDPSTVPAPTEVPAWLTAPGPKAPPPMFGKTMEQREAEEAKGKR